MRYEAAQKKLYEILGLGCWHEVRPIGMASQTHFGGTPKCKHCGKWMDWLNTPMPNGQTDLTTWPGFGILFPAMQKHEKGDNFMQLHGGYYKLHVKYINPERFFLAVCEFFNVEVK